MNKKKPLSPEQLAECEAAHRIFLKKKKELGLSQKKVADKAGISAPAVNLYFKGINPLNVSFALVLSDILKVKVDEFSPRLAKEIERYASAMDREEEIEDEHSLNAYREEKSSDGLIRIVQFQDVSGSMGSGLLLSDQPGQITGWSVTKEWITKNIPSNTGDKNLKIVTGFGDSMKGMFNSGDPLLIDVGITDIKWDGVYFFRIGEEGFIKRLQRIPGQGIRALSANPEYEAWTITADMDFQILGLVLKVWEGSSF